MAEDKPNTYSLIIKAMGVFGGVQALGILCSIIRTKLVAMWIGPAGVGLFGIFNSAIDMIASATQLGMRGSSVRDIAQAQANNDTSLLSIIVTVVRRWAWVLGIFGAFITLALAPILSKITFGDDTHIWGFVILSITMIFSSVAGGELAVLQGKKRLKRLARSSVLGSVLGLILSIPLFYYCGEDSIVPAIAVYSAMYVLGAWLYRDKETKSDKSVTFSETVTYGRGFIALGIYMTLGSFLSLLFSYIFIAYLNNVSGIDEVGYYQAGYTLVNKYVAVIFTAIGMEYYPRLAAINTDKRKLQSYVSQETEVSLMVLAPIIVLFIMLQQWIIDILYTSQFQVIQRLVSWSMIGVMFKAISWCMAYVILAKGSGRVFLITEALSVIIGFIFNIIGYKMYGLEGIGISMLATYIIYAVIIAVVYRNYYHLSISCRSVWLFVSLTPACAIVMALYMMQYTVGAWVATGATVIASIWLYTHYHKQETEIS